MLQTPRSMRDFFTWPILLQEKVMEELSATCVVEAMAFSEVVNASHFMESPIFKELSRPHGIIFALFPNIVMKALLARQKIGRTWNGTRPTRCG